MAGEGRPQIRRAERRDAEQLWSLIRELARYEQLEESLSCSPHELAEGMFAPESGVEALLALESALEAPRVAERSEVPAPDEGERMVGCAIYYPCFSTFLGRRGLYLEDLYVRESHRGLGIGWALLRAYAARAQQLGAGYLEWRALHWNEPAIRFYAGLGAQMEPDWRVFRLKGEALNKLAAAPEASP